MASSAAAHDGSAYQAYAPAPAAASTAAAVSNGQQTLSDAVAAVFSTATEENASATAAGGAANEVEMVIGRLFQTLSQNPNIPMADFMRSIGRDVEEAGTCK